MFQTVNPATGLPLKQYVYQTDVEVQEAIDRSLKAFEQWQGQSWEQHVSAVNLLVKSLKRAQAKLAHQIMIEMGKPIIQARAEVSKCIDCCEQLPAWVAEWKRSESIVTASGVPAQISFEPLGVIFAIMPWNFPIWQIIRCWLPAVLMGNAMLLSPSATTQGSAELFAECVDAAGFPRGLLSVLTISDAQAHEVIQNKKVSAVTFTGSQRAGSAVAASAGAALKKTVLELGGSDPYIVLPDADLDLAADVCIKARLLNAGQVCISAKRLIVHASIFDDFYLKLMKLLAPYQANDPALESTWLGPLAREDLRAHLHQQVSESIRLGATCLQGGVCPQGPGYFYPVTVMKNIQKGMPAYGEELFGPVISLFKVASEAEAVTLANDTDFGLTGVVFSKDIQLAQRLANQLIVGSCGINQSVHSYFEVPFGGVKGSGYGRELGRWGCYEFANIKTILMPEALGLRV